MNLLRITSSKLVDLKVWPPVSQHHHPLEILGIKHFSPIPDLPDGSDFNKLMHTKV